MFLRYQSIFTPDSPLNYSAHSHIDESYNNTNHTWQTKYHRTQEKQQKLHTHTQQMNDARRDNEIHSTNQKIRANETTHN